MAVRNILKMLSVAMFATTAGGATLAGDKVVMVGKRMNNLTVLPAGRSDFPKTGNLLLSFDNIRNELPMLFMTANIQKDPPCVLANRGRNNGFSGQSQAPAVLISKDGKFSYWRWIVAEHGFRDAKPWPCGHMLARLLSDKEIAQQRYAAAEPLDFAVEETKFDTYRLANRGWSASSTNLETRREIVEEMPELVQRFVNVSIDGWRNFLYGDRTLANEAITTHGPEMTVERLDAEMEQL